MEDARRWMFRYSPKNLMERRVGRAVVVLDLMEKGISDGNAREGAGVSQRQ